MRHSGGMLRIGAPAEEPRGFDLLDEHIQAICAGVYSDMNGGQDYFPPEVDTLAKRRAYVLQQSPGILGALKSAYEDKANSFLPDAVSDVGYHGTLEAPVKSKTL